MAYGKKDVTLLLTHWNYVFLPLSHWCNHEFYFNVRLINCLTSVCQCWLLAVSFNVFYFLQFQYSSPTSPNINVPFYITWGEGDKVKALDNPDRIQGESSHYYYYRQPCYHINHVILEHKVIINPVTLIISRMISICGSCQVRILLETICWW